MNNSTGEHSGDFDDETPQDSLSRYQQLLRQVDSMDTAGETEQPSSAFTSEHRTSQSTSGVDNVSPKLVSRPVVSEDLQPTLAQRETDNSSPSPTTPLGVSPSRKPETSFVGSGNGEDVTKMNLKNKFVSDEIKNILERDWRDYAHLDNVIAKVKGAVQKTLVDEGYSEKIVNAKTDSNAKRELVAIIEHLTLEELYDEHVNERKTRNFILNSVRDEILGLGPIEVLWSDESITEVICNGPEDIWIEQYGQLKKVSGVRFRSSAHLQEVCEKILLPINRKLDIKSPLADGRLPDGSRVNAVHTRVAPKGPNLTIRKFPAVNFTMKDLVDVGSLTPDMAQTVAWLIRNKATILVSGGTGSGKLLPLNTRLPTPSGWKTMGAVQVGDTLFGGDGEPCQVVAISNIDPNPVLYEIEFSDGQKIVADENHQWLIVDKYKNVNKNDKKLEEKSQKNLSETDADIQGVGEVLTTGAIIERCGNLSNTKELRTLQRGRFAVRLCQPLKLPPVEVSEGEKWEGFSTSAGERSYLQKMLRGSIEQRFNVLREIITTSLESVKIDTHDVFNTFVSVKVPVLSTYVDNIAQLVQTLGMKVVSPARISVTRSPHTTHFSKKPEFGVSMGTTVVEFLTTPEVVKVLTTPHLPKQKGKGEVGVGAENATDVASLLTAGTRGWLSVVNIRPVQSEPGKCIQVNSSDSTYLIEGFIPTHNTTMLNALSAAIPRNERIITIEDSLELRLDPQAHVVPQEAQPADSSNDNAVTIRALTKNSLRMRPNRIIVGEVRDEAALEMLQACNTGHEGSMSTIHANGPNEAVSRLAVMVAQGGEFPAEQVNWLVGSAIDIIITLKRDRTGPRRVDGIYEVPEVDQGEPLKTIPLWEWERTGTDEKTGDPIGHYVEREKMSDKLYKKLELEWNPKPTWEQVVNNFQD